MTDGITVHDFRNEEERSERDTRLLYGLERPFGCLDGPEVGCRPGLLHEAVNARIRELTERVNNQGEIK